MADNRPAIADKVTLKTRQLGNEIGGIGIIDDEKNFAAILDERQIHARVNVAPAVIVGSDLVDLILIGSACRNFGIHEGSCGARQNRSRPPTGIIERFARDSIADGYACGVLRPA